MAFASFTTTAGDIAQAVIAASAGATSLPLHENGGTSTTSVSFPLAVKAFASKTGFVRVYDETLGGSSVANSANLPQLSGLGSVVAHVQYDDAAPWYKQGGAPADNGAWSEAPDAVGTPQVGMVEFHPVVPAADAVTAASVQTFKVDAGTIVVLGTGTN